MDAFNLRQEFATGRGIDEDGRIGPDGNHVQIGRYGNVGRLTLVRPFTFGH